jgi:beta-galactosidase
MCDAYGIYVYDEANIESHGMYYTTFFDMRAGSEGHENAGRGTLGNNPDFTESHLSRFRNMFERNKNYPSVSIWSLGNEAGNGYNFALGYGYLKEADRFLMNRPVCYERAIWDWNTDMYVPQYPGADRLEYLGEKGGNRNMPIVPSEYSHAMGNSSGNLWEQWQAIYKYPNLQGGFIWEWIDHAVKYNKNGREIWAYGGDFGKDQPSDGNFVADGIVNPDQQPHPAMAEVKYTHQNVAFEALDLEQGKINIFNRFYFTDLSEYTVTYSILEDGNVLKQNVLPLSLKPQTGQTLDIPLSGIPAKAGREYFLKFEVLTKQAQTLIPQNHVVAYEQFQLPLGKPKTAYSEKSTAKLTVTESDNTIAVSSSKVNFVFNKAEGLVTSYRVNGVEYFAGGFGLQPNFWRAPTDNDYGNGAPKRLQIWKQASQSFDVVKTTVESADNKVLMTAYYKLPTGNFYIFTATIYPGGIVHFAVKFTSAENAVEQFAALSAEAKEFTAEGSTSIGGAQHARRQSTLEIPRIGVRFRLPVAYENLRYLGRGPEENYVDRNHGTLVGLYQSTATEQYYPYVRPQETGHHTDARWFALGDKKGKGLLIVADTTFGFNALRNSIEDLDCENSNEEYQWRNFSPEEIATRNYEEARNSMRKQTHEADIQPRNFVEVCVDMRQCGVAGYNSWGARPLPQYSLYADREYNYGFTLIPLRSADEISVKTALKY